MSYFIALQYQSPRVKSLAGQILISFTLANIGVVLAYPIGSLAVFILPCFSAFAGSNLIPECQSASGAYVSIDWSIKHVANRALVVAGICNIFATSASNIFVLQGIMLIQSFALSSYIKAIGKQISRITNHRTLFMVRKLQLLLGQFHDLYSSIALS